MQVHVVDGEIVTADVAVVGIGTLPRTDWLTTTGLNLTDGVLCGPTTHVLDEHGHPIDTIVAAGDVARWPNPRFAPDPAARRTRCVRSATTSTPGFVPCSPNSTLSLSDHRRKDVPLS